MRYYHSPSTPEQHAANAKYEARQEASWRYLMSFNTSWAEPKYKKVTDPDSGQKVFTGDGLKIHPSKKHRYKLQAEKDPDTKSNRAAIGVIRPKPLLPVIEVKAKVISKGSTEGNLVQHAPAYTLPNGNKSEYHEPRTVREVVPTSTPEFAYKSLRLEASSLVESVKHSGITPKKFWKDYADVLRSLSRDVCGRLGVSFESYVSYLRDNLPEFAAIVFPASESTPGGSVSVSGKDSGETVAELQKKLKRAEARRDKAIREIADLEARISEHSEGEGVKAEKCSECSLVASTGLDASGMCSPCADNTVEVEEASANVSIADVSMSIKRQRREERRKARKDKKRKKNRKVAA